MFVISDTSAKIFRLMEDAYYAGKIGSSFKTEVVDGVGIMINSDLPFPWHKSRYLIAASSTDNLLHTTKAFWQMYGKGKAKRQGLIDEGLDPDE